MSNLDEFRFHSHHLLLELDAATNRLMMLVSARDVSGYPWDQAVKRQKLAYEKWAAFLCAPALALELDPMPSLDARAAGSFGPVAD